MRVTQKDLEQKSREMLAGVLREDGCKSEWNPDELGDVLRHQLAAPLVFEFAANGTPASDVPSGMPQTFGKLLTGEAPSLPLLEMTKDFARRYGKPGGELPEEVGKVIYFAAIFCAQQRCGQSITTLDDAALRAAAEWALRLPWLDASLKGLFERATAE